MSTLENKLVLVTGGAGFIGSELVRQIAGSGAEIVVVDNLVNGKRSNLEDVLGDTVRLETADVRDEERMRSLLSGVHVVFHLACLGVRHSLHSPRENHDVNSTGTLVMLAAARDARVDRFVCVSSSEVYGTARQAPISEEHPTYPSTVYGASKLAGECYARAYWQSYRFPAVVVRPFNSFGPRCHHEGDSGEVIPRFLLRALAGQPMIVFGDGNQTRDFTYVADTARGILRAALTEEAIGHTINLGSRHEISINELARVVDEAAGGRGGGIEHHEPRPGDVLRLCADTTRARTLLDFKTEVGLREGLERLKQWYESATTDDPARLLEDERIHNWLSNDAHDSDH